MSEITTTLNAIRKHTYGWEKLLTHLGKTKADDEPLPLTVVLDSNGLDDCLWCLRAVDGYDREFRLFAVWCARQVQHLMTNQRSIDALDVAERYANGEATDKDLSAAWAAWAAARAAARAAALAAVRDASAAWTAYSAAARAARAAQESKLRELLETGEWNE